MKKIFLILSATILLACSSVAMKKTQSGTRYDVYMAGYELISQGVLAATLWKNGLTQKLTGGFKVNYVNGYTVSVSGNDVFVSDGDVYVAGFENNVARLWKNGVVQELIVDTSKPSSASGVYVSGDDVYVTGSKTWKNGHVLYGHENGSGNSIFLSEGDIYVAGSQGHDAVVWKNGVAQELPGRDGGGDTGANSVYVSQGDVYVAGWNGFFSDRGTEFLIAVLWKNGVEIQLTDMENEAEANSVFVSDADVYVAGRVDNYAVVWKNGVMQKLTEGNHQAIAKSVYVSGSDVYVAGLENGVARLWKNGIIQSLITDGSKSSSANSVFVELTTPI